MHHIVQTIGISMCWIVLVVGAQISSPQSQHYAFNERRRYYNGVFSGGYGVGFSGPSSVAAPMPSDFIKFPDDHSVSTAPVQIVRNNDNGNKFNDRHKNNADETTIESDKIDTSHHRSVPEGSCTTGCVPLSFSKALNTYDDYFKSLDDESQGQFELIAPRFAGENIERSQISRAVPANCIPEMTVVPLRLSDEADLADPTIFIFPSCTRIERCGGCCSSNLLSCQPIESHNVSFQVFKSQHMNGRTKLLGREVVEVEKHTRCKCDCKKKESDCTKYQRYNKASCSCVCINVEDQKKCSESKADKVWESDTCTCKCREELKCSTDTYFDHNTCSCVETPGYRDRQMVDRRRLITKPVIYVPQTPQTYYASASELETQPSQ